LRFQQHDDELLRRVVPGHHTVGVLVAQFLDPLLGEVSEGVARAGHGIFIAQVIKQYAQKRG
jgi:hypothetical protein